MGHYIGNTVSHVSIFKLGWVTGYWAIYTVSTADKVTVGKVSCYNFIV